MLIDLFDLSLKEENNTYDLASKRGRKISPVFFEILLKNVALVNFKNFRN